MEPYVMLADAILTISLASAKSSTKSNAKSNAKRLMHFIQIVTWSQLFEGCVTLSISE